MIDDTRVDRNDLFERVHSVAIRIDLQPAARAQSFSSSISHEKPGSKEPDLSLLNDLRDLDGGLLHWLTTSEERYGTNGDTTMERFHAAIIESSEHGLRMLVVCLQLTEQRLRIEWKGGQHHGLPPVSIAELRATRERILFHTGFGLKTSELEAVMRRDGMEFTPHEVRELRRRHGVDGRTGARKEKCPEAVVNHSFRDGCGVCGVVDDLELERGRPAAA